MKEEYYYSGAVYVFGKLVTCCWSGRTSAVNEGRARSNLKHQYRVQHNYVHNVPIKLTGELVVVGAR
ncbi:MAG: hypothetical protein IKP68_06270 [Clostridia bacterium]|nr:hypothetical protein [Clostridia bacterium]